MRPLTQTCLIILSPAIVLAWAVFIFALALAGGLTASRGEEE